jgi:hypothetical protein
VSLTRNCSEGDFLNEGSRAFPCELKCLGDEFCELRHNGVLGSPPKVTVRSRAGVGAKRTCPRGKRASKWIFPILTALFSEPGPRIGRWKKGRQWITSRPNGERRSARVSGGRPRLTLRCSAANEACCVGADPCYLPVGAVAPAAPDEVDLVLTARVGQCLDMAPHDELPLDDKFEE